MEIPFLIEPMCDLRYLIHNVGIFFFLSQSKKSKCNSNNKGEKYDCFASSAVILSKHSTETSSSHTGCGENVRMCTQYGAQGHVKIKIPSSLLWIIFWVGPDTRWSDLCALLKHCHTFLSLLWPTFLTFFHFMISDVVMERCRTEGLILQSVTFSFTSVNVSREAVIEKKNPLIKESWVMNL